MNDSVDINDKEKSVDKDNADKNINSEINDNKNENADNSNKDENKGGLVSGDRSSLYLEPYVDASVGEYKKKKKIWKVVFLTIVCIILLAYAGGVIYNYNYFAPDTNINSIDISGKSVKAVQDKFASMLNAYELQVSFKDCKEKICVGDGGLAVNLEKSIADIKKEQNPFLWFVHFIKAENYDIAYIVSYDEAKLKEFIYKFNCMDENNMVAATDAFVKIRDGRVVVTKDKAGTVLDKDKVFEVICKSLDSMDSKVNLDSEGCYLNALIREDSDYIARQVEKAENFLSIDARLVIDKTTIKIMPEELTKLAYIDDSGNITISSNNVKAFAENFVKNHNTSYTDRSFTTHDGKKIMVHGDYYGWEFDAEQFETMLFDALNTKKDFELEVPFFHRGYVYDDGDDIGDNYVEIDLSNQKVYVYIEGRKVYEADCVSGNVRLGHSTPGGLFGLTYKARNTVLVGADYQSPVAYWMPFNKGIGMHDASWRGRFGGEIYKTDGSHGCINLYIADAAAIYDYVESNFPIVCYWRE